MEIKDEHVEYAVVERLSAMLKGSAKSEFPVTQTYALFTTLLCWIIQRLRRDSNWTDNFREPIENEPWLIFEKNEPERQVKNIVPLSKNFSTAKITYIDRPQYEIGNFLIDLRNSVAHGDHRNISPIHSKIGNKASRRLEGFEFKLKDRGERELANVVLGQSDMHRIGISLATRFLENFGVNTNFAEDAKRGVLDNVA